VRTVAYNHLGAAARSLFSAQGGPQEDRSAGTLATGTPSGMGQSRREDGGPGFERRPGPCEFQITPMSWLTMASRMRVKALSE
jgi:hypothetical protein